LLRENETVTGLAQLVFANLDEVSDWLVEFTETCSSNEAIKELA
jgi:hypothetical protein